MYRLVRMTTSHWYGIEIDSVQDDFENIKTFAEESNIVLIVPDKSDALELIDEDDITWVEHDDN